MTVIVDVLIYKQIRVHSPQWEVSIAGGHAIAIVTERYLSTPTYALRPLNVVGVEGAEEFFEDRDAVSRRVLDLANNVDERVRGMDVSVLPRRRDEYGRWCWVVERVVYPDTTAAEALHGDHVNAGLCAVGLEPDALPQYEVVRELIPIPDGRR